MTIKRSIVESSGQLFFAQDLPMFVNRVQESFEMQQHSHDFIEISYVAEGNGSHYMNNERMSVTKGDLFYLPVGVSHVFRPSSTNQKKPLIVYNCIFTQSWMDELLQQTWRVGEHEISTFFSQLSKPDDHAEQPPWLTFREQFGEFQPLFERLHLEFNSRRSGYITVMQACIAQLLVSMHRSAQAPLPVAGVTPLSNLESLLAHLRVSYNNPMTLSEAADQLAVSDRQLQRQLMKLTGMSFTANVQHARLEACCKYLRESNHTISEIAALIGYQDMKYFNQLFKKRIGVTPSQYRQQHDERKRPLPSRR
ncbi:AraC family transcriptional regulator [Paenibacillus roseipurpureus]|uniref:AraC family transcriptional regulator n=1 Tax=Paenibacillus roseopurpureus TaxID=2918901 RepID=A0AA96RIC2_9BACL|nr:AraC family transcriptional regulator [Paenibacillus sp. MBLB1832]WNR42620.1 AraC family transcriptional regulator [Paenibacillus sp. MBLB1832]